MKKNQNGFGAIEILLVIVIAIILAGLGWVAWNTLNKTNSSKNKNSAVTATTTQSSSKPVSQPPQAHTPQEAVSFTQNTYDTFLAAVKAGNDYNTNNPGPDNKTLPRYGLDAIKDSLTPDLYSRILNEEQTKRDDDAGCALYQVDRYTASLDSSSSVTAKVNVGINGGNNGTIAVGVDLTNLKITSIACPNN